jgi:carbamate kinase
MKIVAALGGNALLLRGEKMTAEAQRANVRKAARSLAALINAGHAVVITHGNGPQVGLIALQSAAGPSESTFPLDVLGAESEGMVGYLIEQEMRNALPESATIATLLTQTRVDAKDPAFRRPEKPIGPTYDEAEADRLKAEKGWAFAKDGSGWRRVVASPEPLEILEMRAISILVDSKVIVICAGGGGVPVVEAETGDFVGIEAVIDKDRASALLARQLGADLLLLLTDVDGVYADFGKATARRLERADPRDLTLHDFAAGSMGPKVDAGVSFVLTTGRPAAIGRLEDAVAMVEGRAGTRIVLDGGRNREGRRAS